MANWLKQNWFKISLIGCLLIYLMLAISSQAGKFSPGKCVQGLDGYIWHINRLNMGEYYLMGWQGKAWGNEVKLDKSILERKTISGIPEYHEIECLEFNPS